jgi:hypothetical protein
MFISRLEDLIWDMYRLRQGISIGAWKDIDFSQIDG